VTVEFASENLSTALHALPREIYLIRNPYEVVLCEMQIDIVASFILRSMTALPLEYRTVDIVGRGCDIVREVEPSDTQQYQQLPD